MEKRDLLYYCLILENASEESTKPYLDPESTLFLANKCNPAIASFSGRLLVSSTLEIAKRTSPLRGLRTSICKMEFRAKVKRTNMWLSWSHQGWDGAESPSIVCLTRSSELPFCPSICAVQERNRAAAFFLIGSGGWAWNLKHHLFHSFTPKSCCKQRV